MSLSKRAIQRRALRPALLWIALVSLREPVVAADPNQTDRAKLSSLQQKIEELDRAGKYREAIPIAEEHLKLIESIAGLDGVETASKYDKLGKLYRKNGDYAKARLLCERGLEIQEKVLGPDDPHTAESLNNLALIYVTMGDPKTAEPLSERALRIREKALGP